MPLLSAAKKERPARQLADVEHIPREQEPLAEDRCQHIRVLAGAHRSEEHDLRFVPEPLRERGSRSLQRQRRRSRSPVEIRTSGDTRPSVMVMMWIPSRPASGGPAKARAYSSFPRK
jgi:hypothetical protein